MKNIALIVFGVIALAIAALVVLIMTLPTAKVTIVAIRPTGEVARNPDVDDGTIMEPVWLFGITNVGGASAGWNAAVHWHSPTPDATSGAITIQSQEGVFGVSGAGMFGVLKPGEGLVTNMIVPMGDNLEWSGVVTFDTQPTPLQQRLWYLRVETLGMRPKHGFYRRSESSWHPATNLPMASSTVTNTP